MIELKSFDIHMKGPYQVVDYHDYGEARPLHMGNQPQSLKRWNIFL